MTCRSRRLLIDASVWCACGPATGELPPKVDRWRHPWMCSVCGKRRRYHEKIVVANGGVIARCGECLYRARRSGERVGPDLVRLVTCTTCTAGEYRETETYRLCDACADQELARQRAAGADALDYRDMGRRAAG